MGPVGRSIAENASGLRGELGWKRSDPRNKERKERRQKVV